MRAFFSVSHQFHASVVARHHFRIIFVARPVANCPSARLTGAA
jgi:hypothetical protein